MIRALLCHSNCQTPVPKYGWSYVLTYVGIIFAAYLICGFGLAGIKCLRFAPNKQFKNNFH